MGFGFLGAGAVAMLVLIVVGASWVFAVPFMGLAVIWAAIGWVKRSR
jgi:hypothetical protein